jgi:antitoxin CptB
MPTEAQAYKSRLYWQCRRGMLELDELLQSFYKQSIDTLSEKQLASFEALLKSHDDLLLEYLMGRTIPVDAGMADVVKRIRNNSTE